RRPASVKSPRSGAATCETAATKIKSKKSSSQVTFRPASPVDLTRSGATSRAISLGCRKAVAVSLAGTPARGQNGIDQFGRHARRHGCIVVVECGSPEADRSIVTGQVAPAVRADLEMLLEPGTFFECQLACQIVADEVRQLATGHDAATSQKILIAPLGFCRRPERPRKLSCPSARAASNSRSQTGKADSAQALPRASV